MMMLLELTLPSKIRKIVRILKQENALNKKALRSIYKYQLFLLVFISAYIAIFYGSEVNVGLFLFLLFLLWAVWHTFWKLGKNFISCYTLGEEISGEIVEYKTNTFLLFEIFDFRIKYKYSYKDEQYEGDTGVITGFLKDGSGYYPGQKISVYVDKDDPQRSAPYTDKLYKLFGLRSK
ncbi:MAG: hypothetical protein R3E13_02150 [Alphaproteobacteria bacterium]